jgi:hypothetical protein
MTEREIDKYLLCIIFSLKGNYDISNGENEKE